MSKKLSTPSKELFTPLKELFTPLKELFTPNKNKILLVIPFAILFWFFPIISRSIIAIPFTNVSSLIFSLIINLAIAYIFSCLIIDNINNKKKLILIIFIILAIYLLIPKVASYYSGDIGGTTTNNCDCYGINWSASTCCHSYVNYCIGICKRNEYANHWWQDTDIPPLDTYHDLPESS